ncbi:MAG: hypothetical protein CVV28_02355 [Methanobacteriales archaeon HGW-Methanobacteriales-1]|jgi:integrative and conjugative element protein (TIGR02256 family)|nr:MAG: hypothetical protein CVV28_02355 [Methanobacteriales archaeon HGW-Methanobacteriales-1]
MEAQSVNLIYRSFDEVFSVEIMDYVLQAIRYECNKAGILETGGILLGNYSVDNSTAIINRMTGPPKDSEHSTHGFYRGIEGIQEIMDYEYKQGKRYIGDWHFHPNNSSKPSFVDDNEMIRIANDECVNCPEPILLIVGGIPDNEFELSIQVYKNGDRFTCRKIL